MGHEHVDQQPGNPVVSCGIETVELFWNQRPQLAGTLLHLAEQAAPLTRRSSYESL
jgi:hypothetical protein